MRQDEQLFLERVNFQFRQDVSLRIQQQRARAEASPRRLDVIDVTACRYFTRSRPGKRNDGMPVRIEQRDGFFRRAIFAFEIRKYFR